MAFKEQFMAAVRTVADKSLEISTDIYEKGKHHAKLFQLQNDLAKAQRNLGALVYSLHKNNEQNEELLNDMFAKIDAIEEEIVFEHAKETPVSGSADENITVLNCPQCGEEVEDGAVFCSGCGNKLS